MKLIETPQIVDPGHVGFTTSYALTAEETDLLHRRQQPQRP